jgi:hypothetical protein
VYLMGANGNLCMLGDKDALVKYGRGMIYFALVHKTHGQIEHTC